MRINKLYMIAVIVGLLVPSISHQLILELPSADLTSVFEHQKELMGKKKTSNVFGDNKNAEQIVSQMVLEIVRESLPKKYKPQSQLVARTIIDEANKYGMDPLLLVSVIKHESNFNPLVVGMVGEIGLMQIRPTTAKWLNDKSKIVKKVDLRNPVINIKIGAFYLNKLRNKFSQNGRHFLSAYNMGAGKLRQFLKKNVNPKAYVGNVLKHYVAYTERLETAAVKSLELLEAEQVVKTAQLCNGGPALLVAQN